MESQSHQAPFFIFDTHPIQYRSPVFSALAKRIPGLQVFYFNEVFNGRKWWFHEVGKIPKQTWNLHLRQGFSSEVLHTSRLSLGAFYKAVRSLLLEKRPVGVVLYGWYLPEHWVLWWLCRRLGIRLVFVGETFSLGSSWWRRGIKKVLHPVFFSGVHLFISIGEKTTQFYRSLKVQASRILQARYCVDVSFFQLPKEKAARVRTTRRQSLRIPEQAVVALFVGRLFERKRPYDMLALHRQMKHLPHYYTVLVGNGPMESELRLAAKDEARFLFAGFCDQPTTREMYYMADLLVVPSEYETWGLVSNEAFAAGRPALVTDTCGAAHDLVQSDVTGYVFPKGDVKAAAHWLNKALQEPETLKKLGKQAQARVQSHYDVDHFAQVLTQAFHRVS